MKTYLRAVAKISSRISKAANRTVENLRKGEVEQEPAFTDRMLARIEDAVDGTKTHGVTWNAKTLTDRGAGAQEKRWGADFAGVLEVDLPDYKVKKGFLAQAKLVRGTSIGSKRDLISQCSRMLDLSPDSFVFLYGEEEIRVVPALSVVAAKGDALGIYSRSVSSFFEAHLECFIGDRSIQAATPAALDELAQRFEARSALLLSAHMTR